MKKILFYILLLIGICLLICSSINIYKWYLDCNATSAMIEKINNTIITSDETSDNEATNNESSKSGIDLSQLKVINPDVARLD